MKKLLLLFLTIPFIIQSASAELSDSSVNLFNLKEKSVYMLSFPTKVCEFNIVNENYVNITPMTSISNDKKLVVIEAQKSGVSDVSIRTEDTLYQFRFVVGPEFQDESKDLIMIDLPSILLGGN